MKKFIGTLLLACLAIGVNAQLLWKVSGNDLERPSYLFGTHHLAPLSILDSIAGFEKAFNETSQVIVELLATEMMSQEAMKLMMENMIIQSDTTLKMLFTEDEFNMVNQFTKENLKLDIETGQKLKPSFIANNIAVIIYMKHYPDYNPQEQLDTYIQQKGTEQNKTISSLETMEFQLNLLLNSQSLQRQAELLACLLSDQEKSFELTKRLTDSYMARDMADLYKIYQLKDGNNCDSTPQEEEAMVDNRNLNWMQKLPAAMKQSPAFIAVGALHLPGENGLINLLTNAGYKVEPVE